MLNASPFPMYQSCGQLSETGRCLSFNATADGFIRSDGGIWVALKPNVSIVDGVKVVKDESPLGTITGSAITHSGQAPMSMHAGPGQLEVMDTAMRCAGLQPADID